MQSAALNAIRHRNGRVTETAYCLYNAASQVVLLTNTNRTGNVLDRYEYQYDAAGSITAHNIYGLNLVRRSTGRQSYYFLYNAHGDVVMCWTQQPGSRPGPTAAMRFGMLVSQTGDVNNSILCARYQYDFMTGLYYLNVRCYDSTTGRFITEDTYAGGITIR